MSDVGVLDTVGELDLNGQDSAVRVLDYQVDFVIVVAGSQVTDPSLACFGVSVDAERREVLEQGSENCAPGQVRAALFGTEKCGVVEPEQSSANKDRMSNRTSGRMMMSVDHTWPNPNRIPAAQGPIVTIPAVRRRMP